MNNIINNIIQFKYILVPLALWFSIQLFKVIYEYCETKKWNWDRLMGAGGMPSSHSAIVVCLAIMIGKNEGFQSPIFALSGIFALITMYDAAGVRRAVGKQAMILNDIIRNQKLTSAEKLQEMTGHTPVQVIAGAILGVITGVIF